MPKHAVRRGAQAKIRRGSKREFFACVGEAGSAGWGLQSIHPTEPLPPSVGALVFLGLTVLRRSPPVKPSATVPQKTAAHKTFRNDQIRAVTLTDLRGGYQRTRSVNPARHAQPSRRLWRFSRDGLRVAPRRLRRAAAAGGWVSVGSPGVAVG